MCVGCGPNAWTGSNYWQLANILKLDHLGKINNKHKHFLSRSTNLWCYLISLNLLYYCKYHGPWICFGSFPWLEGLLTLLSALAPISALNPNLPCLIPSFMKQCLVALVFTMTFPSECSKYEAIIFPCHPDGCHLSHLSKAHRTFDPSRLVENSRRSSLKGWQSARWPKSCWFCYG